MSDSDVPEWLTKIRSDLDAPVGYPSTFGECPVCGRDWKRIGEIMCHVCQKELYLAAAEFFGIGKFNDDERG